MQPDLSQDAAWALSVRRRGLKPDPLLSVSEWADTHRVLPTVSSAEPGPWRTSRTPYLREIMNRLSAGDPTERVVLMKAAQIGATEAGLNWVGYCVACAPGPMLAVQPTVEGAKRNSKTRIDPLIETSPALRERVRDPRSRDSGNTVLMKEFPGGVLVMTGANSAVGLRSMPVRYLFLDEVDGYPGDADGEGDPVSLALQRTMTFVRRKIFMASTPTLKGFSRIEAAYQESDQRRYHVPCLACDVMQTIEWSRIVWPEGRRDQAGFICEACGHRHAEYQKTALLEAGEWRAMAESDGRTVGFHLSALYSPWLTWAQAAIEHGQVKDDPARLQVWTNTVLGETWEDQAGESADPAVLMERREDWGSDIPAGVAILTAGVDVQDDRLEVEIVGWGREEESWSIAYEVIHGDPSSPRTWKALDELLLAPLRHARAVPDLTVAATSVDMGGHYSDSVLEYAHARKRRAVWAIKGSSDPLAPIWPAQFSRDNRKRRALYIVGVNRAKDVIGARLRIVEAGPGCCHFPRDRDTEWFDQLTGEVVRTRYRMGRPLRIWQPRRDGDPVEALDCRVYAYAALIGIQRQRRMKLATAVERIEAAPLRQPGSTAAPAPFKPPAGQPALPPKRVNTWLGPRRGKGWLQSHRNP